MKYVQEFQCFFSEILHKYQSEVAKKQPLFLLLGNTIIFLRTFGLHVKYMLLIQQIKCIIFGKRTRNPIMLLIKLGIVCLDLE